jgi:Tetratricopeptide repeat
MAPVITVLMAFKPWVDPGPWRWPVLLACSLVLGIVPRTAGGHGFMTEPRPRSADYLKGDIRGWPIAGAPPRFTRIPCLDMPVSRRFMEVHPGPLQLRFFFGDGANHVGLCRVFLLDPTHPGQKVKIGEMMDCARSEHPGPGRKGEDITGHMRVTIPATVPCDPSHCVLQWEWIATHISVTRPEYYDECVDLTITGAREAEVTAEAANPAERREVKAPGVPLPAPPMAGPPLLAAGEDAVRQMVTYAMANGGAGDVKAIMAAKRQIEALPLNRQLEPGAHQRARAANERGLRAFREGQLEEAVQAFQLAYQLAPTDVEIVNNFGFAYLWNEDPEAAEPWLLLALVLSPGRVNAWVNLGEAYAKQGQRNMAIACMANGYRFSKNQAATRQFLQTLADDEKQDSEIREVARQTLQLPLGQAG